MLRSEVILGELQITIIRFPSIGGGCITNLLGKLLTNLVLRTYKVMVLIILISG
jgi:hypothetical protein